MLKKLVLLMMLIVGQQILLSQTHGTSLEDGSIVLNRTKKIEIAKIITSERLLRTEVKLLKTKVTELEGLVKSKNTLISTLENKTSTLESITKDQEVLEAILRDKISGAEATITEVKKTSSTGFYLWTTMGNTMFTDRDNKTGIIGIGLVKNSILAGVGVNPLNYKMEYHVTIGIKLFRLQ